MSIKIHENIIEKLDNFIIIRKIPNIIFHGASGSGKRTIVHDFINKIYKTDTQESTMENIKNNVMYINCAHGKGIKFIRDELKFFAKTQINYNSGNFFKQPHSRLRHEAPGLRNHSGLHGEARLVTAVLEGLLGWNVPVPAVCKLDDKRIGEGRFALDVEAEFAKKLPRKTDHREVVHPNYLHLNVLDEFARPHAPLPLPHAQRFACEPFADAALIVMEMVIVAVHGPCEGARVVRFQPAFEEAPGRFDLFDRGAPLLN